MEWDAHLSDVNLAMHFFLPVKECSWLSQQNGKKKKESCGCLFSYGFSRRSDCTPFSFLSPLLDCRVHSLRTWFGVHKVQHDR